METAHRIGDLIEPLGAVRIWSVFVLADIDGIVAIPEQQAEAVLAEVEKVRNTENLMREAILSGLSPKEAYLRYGEF